MMKEHLLMAVLLLSVAAPLGKSQPQNTNKMSSPQTGKHVTITGCLTRGPHEAYELVDQKGIHNLVAKSERINLDSYVGQSVTLVGERSAMPTLDETTKRPTPYFKVSELKPASGKCGK